MSTAQFVQVIVGGFPFSVAASDIEKYPGSFFETMIKKEWLKDGVPITIERDGALFKYVYSFLVAGHLPRDKAGELSLDEETLAGLLAEADFYGMSALVKECQIRQKKTSTYLDGYMTIRKYLKHKDRSGSENWDVQYSSQLIRALKGVWAPFCLKGRVYNKYFSGPRLKVHQDSTVDKLNLVELIAAATQSPFGRGTETVTDTSVRNSFEIPASELDSAGLGSVKKLVNIVGFAPHLDVELRPYKLVIYKEGGHFHEHRDTVRGDGHIGTLVMILNSEYSGGELEVTHNGRTETVTGAYNWVAMYGDCLHKINPVTSGTRVSLIYDIYGTAPPPKRERAAGEEGGEEEEEEEEEDEEDYLDYEDTPAGAFWSTQGSYSGASRPVVTIHGVDPQLKEDICKGLDAELPSCDSLIITLQHLYPECQTSPAYLKGGDRALFDLLSEHYDVQVVAATIYHSHDYQYREGNRTDFSLFSSSIVNRALGIKSGEPEEDTSDAEDAAAAKKPRLGSRRIKLLIPSHFDDAGLLDYTPYIEHTGNESQAERTVYIVAGLQVRKRE